MSWGKHLKILFAFFLPHELKLLYLKTTKSSILLGPSNTFPSHTGGMAIKKELHDKLDEFATHNDSLEEIFENKEQIEVSRFYERLPKPHAIAIEEWLNEKIYHRNSEDSTI